MVIFSFGASTAEGKKDDTGGGFIGRIGTALAGRPEIECRNLGVGGHTTGDMVERLPDLGAFEELDIAIIALGINDIARSNDAHPGKRVSPESHARNVRSILEYLSARCRVLYVSQYPVDPLRTGTSRDVVRDYVTAGLRVAETAGVQTLNIYSEIDEARFSRFIHEDGLHFNGPGHAYMAHRIIARLTELGWLP